MKRKLLFFLLVIGLSSQAQITAIHGIIAKKKTVASDLLTGYAFLNLSVGQSDVSITRIGNTETWRLYNDGVGKSQPGKKFVKGSAFGIQKKANTYQQVLSITYVQGSNGNYIALSMAFDENGSLKITANHDVDVIDDTPTTQPGIGQYSIFEDISTGTSPLSTRIIRHSILDVDKTTVVYYKDYTIHNTSENDSVIDFVMISQNGVINYPQSKNTVAY
ncbi:hypothetical protein [Pedobacter rhodius]|uniref:Uncharacterized protein n=1 Tax=Pedobacter rhodius TaxID=3004098 RepID=A0ABT4KUA1_9SPHI|nr:hypothetical protein [Pedobacter sp. SJ11]MCZ4222514.1 hypothetical protein [Pedobacter sp. SJ11]